MMGITIMGIILMGIIMMGITMRATGTRMLLNRPYARDSWVGAASPELKVRLGRFDRILAAQSQPLRQRNLDLKIENHQATCDVLSREVVYAKADNWMAS